MLSGITAVLKQMEGAVQMHEAMRAALASGDYAEAYRHCKDCEKEAQRFKHLAPMRLLADAMQDTMKEIQVHVEQALSRLCRAFDSAAYQRVLAAYESMRMMQYVVFKIPEFFEDAVKLAATQALSSFVPTLLRQPHPPTHPLLLAHPLLVCIIFHHQGHPPEGSETKTKYKDLLTRLEEDRTGANPFRSAKAQRERASVGGDEAGDDIDEEELVDVPQDEELCEKQEDGVTPVGRTPDGFDTLAGPVVVPTSLRVIRTVGRYVSMMEILSPIALDAFHGMTYLVDLFIYTVFSLFALSPTHTNDMQDWFVFSAITPRLRNLLVHLRDQFINKPGSSSALAPGIEVGAAGGIAVNFAVQERLNSEASMFGIVLRTVSTESLMLTALDLAFRNSSIA
eukprot:tig00021294_g20031.t1